MEAQGGETRTKYGDGLIKEYSRRLTIELNKKYSYRNLMNMRKFYLIFSSEIVNALRSQLTWSHYRELLTLDNKNEILYYINISVEQNLSYRELHNKTKEKLITKEENNVTDFIKNSILIKNKYDYKNILEKILKQLILEDMDNFLTELGDGFCYIKNEYKINITI